MTVTFRQPEEADVCIATVHRRWFDGRSLHAEAWDGRTKYTIQESQEEMEKRLSKWHKYIEGDSSKTGDTPQEDEDRKTQPPDTVPPTAVDTDTKMQSDTVQLDAGTDSETREKADTNAKTISDITEGDSTKTEGNTKESKDIGTKTLSDIVPPPVSNLTLNSADVVEDSALHNVNKSLNDLPTV